jgi:hypothetical protein
VTIEVNVFLNGHLESDPFEAFAGRAFRGGSGGMQAERRLLDLFADESVAEVFRPALADGLRFRAFGEHEEGHISPAAGLVSRTLRSVGWLSTQTVLRGANSSQRTPPVMGNHWPWAYCQTRTKQLMRPAGLVSALRASSEMKPGSFSSGR